MKLDKNNIEETLYEQIEELLSKARNKIVSHVNRTMVYTYFEIGRIIVEYEQDGNKRAVYGKKLLKKISNRLSNEFGRGFSTDNLENMRRFYLTYSKSETLSRKSEIYNFQLSWSHYLKLVRVNNEVKKNSKN